MKRAILALSCLLILGLFAVPTGLAEDATPVAPVATQQPLFVAVQAYCSADCTYGPDVSCSGNTCLAHDDPNGYVTCDGQTTYCPATQPLSVTLSILGCQQIGAKAIYDLRANASGGTGSYHFSYNGANATYNYTSNPNYATSTQTYSHTASVTVTSGTQSDQDSVYLPNPCSILE